MHMLGQGKRRGEAGDPKVSVCGKVEDGSLGGNNQKLAQLPLDHFCGWNEGRLGF